MTTDQKVLKNKLGCPDFLPVIIRRSLITQNGGKPGHDLVHGTAEADTQNPL
jgi:hypothetical protein